MTGFFLALCTLLSNILNPIILILMIFELGLGVIVGWQLVHLKREINRLNASGRRANQRTLRKGRGQLTTTFESITEKDWNDFDAFLGLYQRDLVTCNFFSLLIQIFPLLGILGTVAGLYIAINSGQDIYEGVKFALSSTVYGIMAAVLFKIVDIIFTARFLNYIDDGIDRFEKNYHIVSQEAQADKELANAGTVSSSEEWKSPNTALAGPPDARKTANAGIVSSPKERKATNVGNPARVATQWTDSLAKPHGRAEAKTDSAVQAVESRKEKADVPPKKQASSMKESEDNSVLLEEQA